MALFDKKKKKKKKANWKLRLGIPALLLAILLWYGLKPLVGSKQYALCKTFVELQLKYPDTLKVVSVDRFQNEQRIYYVYIGPYGERRIDMMGCVFGSDPETGLLRLSTASLNRETLPDRMIEGFNQGLPYVQKLEMDRDRPAEWDGTYMGLKDE